MTNKPSIRINGFNDEWRCSTIGDEGDFYYGRSCPKWSVSPDAPTPCIRYGELYSKFGTKIDKVYSYTNMPPNKLRFSKGKEVLVPRVGEDPMDYNHCSWLSIPNVAIGEMISVYNTNHNPLFTATMFNATLQKDFAVRVEGFTVTNLYYEKLKSIGVHFPSASEQTALGKFFLNFDNLISLHQKKLDRLMLTKKAMLIKLFPQNGSTVPEIRFKEFSGEWEHRPMKEIVTRYEAPVPLPQNGYHRLGIRSHAKGTFHSYVESGGAPETAQMYQVAADNFIVNITFGWEHAVAITDENDTGKLVSHRFPQFSFNEGMVPQYFKYLIIDKKFKHHLWLSSPGGAGRNRVLKIDEMLEYKFWTPSEPEQKKIADFFNNLDNLISLQEAKIEKLKNTKKALLKKMFV